MKTYIALLRGINVSGQKIIKMETLREVLNELKFENISTYIQSGNIIFQTSIADVKRLELMIAEKIESHFGFVVPVIVVTPQALQLIVEKNPFVEENAIDDKQPYVTFLSDIPLIADLKILKAIDFSGDRFVHSDKSIYLHYATSAGTTKLNNVMIEKKLKIQSTMRNWKTILKLMELAEALPT